MAQSDQFHETWAYLRDNAKPIVPDDVYDLREVRTFQPPSKGHVKRVQRVRPEVVTQHPRMRCTEARRLHNQAAAIGRRVSDYVKSKG